VGIAKYKKITPIGVRGSIDVELNRPYPDTDVDITQVIPIEDINLLVEFANGKKRRYDVKRLFTNFPQFKKLESEELFYTVKHGKYAVYWDETLDIAEVELWYNGSEV
jgi:hypothetical protein